MKTTILFQGDSITDAGRTSGVVTGNAKTSIGTGYPSLVTARLMRDNPGAELEFVNRGVGGNRVVDLYARWRIDCLNIRPGMLSILIGVNDVWHEENANGVEAPRFERFYRELLNWTKDTLPNVRILLLEPFICRSTDTATAMLPEVEKRAAATRTMAKEFGTALVPLQRLFDDASKLAPPAYWAADGVHPTAAGHQLIADAWLAAMPLNRVDTAS